jgi:hypothetical protein
MNPLSQGIPLGDVQYLTGRAEPRTTRLYDRRQNKVTRNVVERSDLEYTSDGASKQGLFSSGGGCPVISIDSVSFEGQGLVAADSQGAPDARQYTDRDGNLIVLRFFSIPPNIPASLSRLDMIWKSMRCHSLFSQAACVFMECGMSDDLDYIIIITKFLIHGHLKYQGSLIIPRRDFSFTFVVQCSDNDPSGKREAVARAELKAAVKDEDELSAIWNRDPYGFPLVAPLMYNASEDERWDNVDRHHPLSRTRELLRRIAATCRFDQEVKQSPSFAGPPVGQEIEQELESYLSVFSPAEGECEAADMSARRMNAMLERLIAECGLDTSTKALQNDPPVYAHSDPREFVAQFKNRPPSPAQVFADQVGPNLERVVEGRTCLILYVRQPDEGFVSSTRLLSQFHASKHRDPGSLQDADVLFATNPLHWEFLITRLLKTVGFQSFAVRTPGPAEHRYGTCYITATDQDWYAKFIVISLYVDIIVFASLMTENMAKEIGFIFGNPATRKKIIYRSSDDKFHIGDDPDPAFEVQRLPELAMYVLLRAAGLPVSIGNRGPAGSAYRISSITELLSEPGDS